MRHSQYERILVINPSWYQGGVFYLISTGESSGVPCRPAQHLPHLKSYSKEDKGDRDQFFIEDHHEPIVSKEEFELVEQLLQQRAREKNIQQGNSRYRNRYPFSNKLICGECGGSFKRHINTSGDLRYAVWVCSKHLDDRSSCSMLFVREALLRGRLFSFAW